MIHTPPFTAGSQHEFVGGSPAGARGEGRTDALAHRTDVGMGYWRARALLNRCFPLRNLPESVPLEWLEALEECAGAFAAFVLAHPQTAALPAPTTDATGARDRQAACEAGLRAALAAVSDRQERDAAAARLQDQYGAPAYQAARILAALTSTPGAPTP